MKKQLLFTILLLSSFTFTCCENTSDDDYLDGRAVFNRLVAPGVFSVGAEGGAEEIQTERLGFYSGAADFYWMKYGERLFSWAGVDGPYTLSVREEKRMEVTQEGDTVIGPFFRIHPIMGKPRSFYVDVDANPDSCRRVMKCTVEMDSLGTKLHARFYIWQEGTPSTQAHR